MKVSRRLTVAIAVVTTFGLASVSSSAWAKGGGGGGGGGNPGSQPYIQFKSGGYSVTEGTTNAIIQVQRVPKGADAVNFSTNGSPNGAVGGPDCSDPATDYVIQTNQGVSIGTNGVGTATVPICDNSYFENSETVNLVLSQRTTTPVGGKITATLTINDNDTAPVLSVNSQTGNEGDTKTFTVTASSANPLLPMSVHWSTSDGTAATADGDYATQSGDVALAPGATSTTFDVSSINDSVYEPGANQYFYVNLSAPVNASLDPVAKTGKYNIVDDGDAAPTLSVDDSSATEGGTITFTVTRTGATDVPATVDWSTAANGSAYAGSFGTNCSTPGYDYVSAQGTGLSIAASGATNTATFDVTTCEDSTPESNETFTVNLANAAASSISDGTGVGTINDNDNGGFETGDLTGWQTYVDGNAPTPSATTDAANSGSDSAVVGTPGDGSCVGEPTGYSAIYRDITVPATGTTMLSAWVLEGGDSNFSDGQFAQIKQATSPYNVLATVFDDGANNSGTTWLHKTLDLTPFAGQTVQLIFVAYQDGACAPTGMHVDDVQITTGA